MKDEYRENEGDVCIEFHERDGKFLCAVGRWHKGLFEWVGKDLCLHRYQGHKVLFSYEAALKIIAKISEKEKS